MADRRGTEDADLQPLRGSPCGCVDGMLVGGGGGPKQYRKNLDGEPCESPGSDGFPIGNSAGNFNMDQKERIKLFVQDTLGCQCSEEVFHHIERISGSVDVETQSYSEKLVVGRRLLIYILRLQDPPSVSDYLPRMLEMGIKERDDNGLKRFRAVLATPDPYGLKPIAEKIFSQLDIRDDKVHLHIVDSKKLPG